MTKLLIRLFIKDSENVKSERVRSAYGKLASVVGILSNFFLFLIKMLAGLLFHSVSIAADAVNNLSDASSSVITLAGFKLAERPADEQHPYGHARYEYISGLIVSFIILLLGVELLKTSFDKILHPQQVIFSWLSVAVLAVSILLKLWQSLFNRTVGKKIGSVSLEATAADSRNDVITTSAVLLAALIAHFTGWNLDGYMGVAVAGFILFSGFQLVRETLNPLLGAAPDQELVEQIQQKILSYDGVLGLHDLVIHNYGPERCFASVHIEVSAGEDILKSHDMIDNIERDFSTDCNIHLVGHLDPIVTDDEQLNRLREQTRLALGKIDPSLTMHDFRVVTGSTHTNLIFDIVVPPRYPISDNELRRELAEKISRFEGGTYYAVITVDRSYVSTTNKEEK